MKREKLEYDYEYDWKEIMEKEWLAKQELRLESEEEDAAEE